MICSDLKPLTITCDNLPEAEKGYWYPSTKELIRLKREKRGLCILCIGHGQLKDSKTGKIRTCLCCEGTGRMKPKKTI